MHCYLDMVYQKWLLDPRPSPIPLAPIVTDQSSDSVSIYWLPPMRGPLYQRYHTLKLWILMVFNPVPMPMSEQRCCVIQTFGLSPIFHA